MYLCAVLVLLMPAQGFAENELWSHGRASTTPQGRWIFGLWSPSALPIADDVAIESRLLLNVIYPNIGMKVTWQDTNWRIATTHTLSYPTRLHNVLSNRDATTDAAIRLAVSNAVHMEFVFDPLHSLTLNVALDISPALSSGTSSPIQHPWFYPRSATQLAGYGAQLGARWRGHLTGRMTYWNEVTLFVHPGGTPTLEHTSALAWHIERLWSLEFGVITTHGTNYTGTMISPYLDIVFALTSPPYP